PCVSSFSTTTRGGRGLYLAARAGKGSARRPIRHKIRPARGLVDSWPRNVPRGGKPLQWQPRLSRVQ
ncbi:MAG: hypothetical protein ACXW5W_13095, partial [Candidatus Binatia bacterium]